LDINISLNISSGRGVGDHPIDFNHKDKLETAILKAISTGHELSNEKYILRYRVSHGK
jgi:hypothetical protein